MQPKHLAIAACLAILVAPTALASPTSLLETEPAPPGGNCSGDIDFACFHWECTNTFCIRLFCPVYLRHGNHAGNTLAGCF